MVQPGEHGALGRFSGSILTEQSVNLATPEVEVDRVNGADAIEGLGQTSDLEVCICFDHQVRWENT